MENINNKIFLTIHRLSHCKLISNVENEINLNIYRNARFNLRGNFNRGIWNYFKDRIQHVKY